METKKKYTINAATIVEMLCSAILTMALFLPWIRVEVADNSKFMTLVELGQQLALIYGGVCILNFFLKFFIRSRWLSVIVGLIAVGMHFELGADKFNSDPQLTQFMFISAHYRADLGELTTFYVGIVLLVVAFISGLYSTIKSLGSYYRNKQHLKIYFSWLSLYFTCFFAILLVGCLLHGGADQFLDGNNGNHDSPFFFVLALFIVVGLPVFILWAIIGTIIWLFRHILKKDKEKTDVVVPKEHEVEQSRVCPSCGANIPWDVAFCPVCDQRVYSSRSPYAPPSPDEQESMRSVISDMPQHHENPIRETATSLTSQTSSSIDFEKSNRKWLYISGGIVLSLLIVILILLFLLFNSNDTSKADSRIEEIPQRSTIYKSDVYKEYCFIVISKKSQSLKVYEAYNSDTSLVAVFPACLSKNYGPKQGEGDQKTPECSIEYPFTICQIQDASHWKYDFGDGRGKIRAYGHWFLRLDTGFDGLGIQGSTNNESSVPGRESSGSIRLRDEDIIFLKENYAFIGMKVIIKHEDEGLFGFEQNCIEKTEIR